MIKQKVLFFRRKYYESLAALNKSALTSSFLVSTTTTNTNLPTSATASTSSQVPTENCLSTVRKSIKCGPNCKAVRIFGY